MSSLTTPTTDQRPSIPRPAGVDPHDVKEWLAAGRAPRLLDVRSPAEFAAAHIPGSWNVPLDLLREHRDELRAHLDAVVVLVCRSGARATQAETLLGSQGPANLHVLAGGITGWEAAGGELNRGRETWELERQVRLVAGGIVLAGVLVSTVAPRAKWLSGAIGGGLTVAALTDSCAMGMLLSRMPWNRRDEPDVRAVLQALAA